MNRRRIAERAIILAGGTPGISVNYDPDGFGDLVTERRWRAPKFSACQELATRLALEACEMKQGMRWCNRVDGGNVWMIGWNLIRIKQYAPYAWKKYRPDTKWDIRLGDAVEVINNYGPHTFVITNISYDDYGRPSLVDTADYGQNHAAGGKPAGASARCYLNRAVAHNGLGHFINGWKIEGRLDIMALREKELGLAESDPGASPAPLPDPQPIDIGTVIGVQRALNQLGENPPLVEDGKWGKKTMAAVIRFQQSHNLRPDGIVGKNTKTALLNALDVGSP